MTFDLDASIRARDAGMARVSRSPFMEDAMAAISFLPYGLLVTGEDIRYILEVEEGIRPHDPHAWGALIAYAIRQHLLVDTGIVRKMRCVTSHARKTSLYRVVVY